MDPTINISGLGSYLPGDDLDIDFFGVGDDSPASRSPLLSPPRTRHHVARDERAGQMVEQAARPMFERLGVDPESVDLLITNTLLPDTPITGCGAEAAHLLGCRPDWIVDLHNGGCGSFAYMLKLAHAIMAGGGARSALLANVQNTAGQLFMQPEVRATPQCAVPGDGCGVTYVTAGDGGAPVLGVETRNEPGYAEDMGLRLVDGRKYWEPGESEMSVSFSADKRREIMERGNRLVPEVVSDLCERIGVSPGDIDVLITNQPNRVYLRNWRRALGIDPERHVDTFDELGNLYGAGLPITLEHATRTGVVGDGDLVVVSGFAHAGDFAAAAALRWSASAAPQN